MKSKINMVSVCVLLRNWYFGIHHCSDRHAGRVGKHDYIYNLPVYTYDAVGSGI